ncbi:MAG: hypothetical protein WCK54_19475, partial [Desulfuromonadales bacterium]
ENPRVGGSIPSLGTTKIKNANHFKWLAFFFNKDILILVHRRYTSLGTIKKTAHNILILRR